MTVKGQKHTEESKQKMRDAKHINHGMRGKHHSEESRGKMSRSHKLNKYDNSGENNPNYGKIKNTNRSISARIRGLHQYKSWRNGVLVRDNKCKKCGSDKEILVHHIKSLKRIIEENNIISVEDAIECDLLWDESNGVSICQLCHIESVI